MKSRSHLVISGALSGALAAVLTAASVAFATPNNWTGGGDNLLWSDGANWSAGEPAAGHAVTVTAGSILLTNETAELASFTMTGGTLTFTNWMTQLRAVEVLLDGNAILTLPPAFTDIQESNRVWIVCSNLMLTVDARIDANERGYAATFGEGYSVYGGPSHGGYGSPSRWTEHAATYGNVAAPTAPGSGGRGTANPVGGGAIFIEASGQVSIHGALLANGWLPYWAAGNQTAGSGGSIYIICHTFSGSATGFLSARAGMRHGTSSASGGGRIAVVYNSDAQSQMDPVNPGVRFSARRGGQWNTFLPGNSANPEESVEKHVPDAMAEPGTLYLPDAQFLSSVMGSQWDDVRIVIPALDEWHVPSLTISGKFGFDPPMRWIRVDGDLILEDNPRLNAFSQLMLYSSPTNDVSPPHGIFLDVGGHLSLSVAGAMLELVSNPTNGATPYIECARFTMDTNSKILADYRGYHHSAGPSWANVANPSGGGGYGGLGGGRHGDARKGQTYGHAHAPIYPGSGGYGTHAGRGGGLVRISSRGAMRIDGTISVDGMNNVDSNGSGGSGGGILLTTQHFTGTGELRVSGGAGAGLGRGGGGGRIAVWTPFMTYETLNAWAATGYLSPAADVLDPAEHWSDLTIVHTPGSGGTGDEAPQAGTSFFGAIRVGTLLKIR